jgi:hypothetical protein
MKETTVYRAWIAKFVMEHSKNWYIYFGTVLIMNERLSDSDSITEFSFSRL